MSVEYYYKQKLEDTAKYYFSTGILEHSVVYVDNVANGQTILNYKDGLIRMEGYYKNGRLDSVCRLYNDDEKLGKELIYRDDSVYKIAIMGEPQKLE